MMEDNFCWGRDTAFFGHPVYAEHSSSICFFFFLMLFAKQHEFLLRGRQEAQTAVTA